MSMNGNLRRIAATDLRRIKDDEGFREALVGFGGMGLGDIAGVLAGLPWYLRLLFRLTGVKTGPQAGIRANAALPDQAIGGEVLGLHKSWHGLHWLISQDPWEGGPLPLKNAIFGEAEIGADLTGYGPPKLNSPERVQEIERALAALSATDLIGRFNGKRMDELEIYPGNFGEDSSWRGDLRRDYSLLREFYKRAAQSGDGVVTWIA